MEDIQVGEYVRTSYGEIGTYIGEDTKFGMYDYDVNGNKSSCIYYELVKHSFNIIDLIEVGDYVNGEKVEEIKEPSLANDYNRLVFCNEREGEYNLFFNRDIKSIVTKEQFETMKYKLEE